MRQICIITNIASEILLKIISVLFFVELVARSRFVYALVYNCLIKIKFSSLIILKTNY